MGSGIVPATQANLLKEEKTTETTNGEGEGGIRQIVSDQGGRTWKSHEKATRCSRRENVHSGIFRSLAVK
ncbi:unnamed protein product, partial [Nesidiocoris tenuis]